MSEVPAVTPEIEKEILAEYRKNPQRFSPFRTASAVGASIDQVFAVVDANKESAAKSDESHGGYGKPNLRRYLIARKKGMTSGWNNDDPKIKAARDGLEEGTNTMVTGRDGTWILLYSIPLKTVRPRPNYFAPENH